MTVDFDYAGEALVLPRYNPGVAGEDGPGLPDRDMGLLDVYADTGVEIVINQGNSSKVRVCVCVCVCLSVCLSA